ncbi:hypothetical protein [Rhodopseudomonas palustris]|uniref:hypothetical protein n=1 Tax=Rhodopseudomonas palustris TaxID=1076 RepID=UPI0012EEAA33
MSLQVAILKVLSSYPNGCATVDMLKADLAILGASGKDWTDRMNQMLARAPQLDIFGQRLVVRNAHGWEVTAAGRELLSTIEVVNVDAPRSAVPTAEASAEMADTTAVANSPASPAAPDSERQRSARPQRNFVIIEGGKSLLSAPGAPADRLPQSTAAEQGSGSLDPIDPPTADCCVAPNRG